MVNVSLAEIGRVALIVAAAVVAYLAIRTTVRVSTGQLIARRRASTGEPAAGAAAADLERRITTLQAQALRVTAVAVAVIALLTILREFGVDIGPAVAGLGVVGIAVGFGAQTLIRDWLAGIFIIVENQYSQGDTVQLAGVSGVVEEFSLRRTTLRDLDGAVHTVPNGQIIVATNLTRGWARVNIDVPVAYDADIEHATRVINEAGEAMHTDPAWAERLLEAPTVVRVNALGDSGVALKVLGRVRPAEQWAVAGELRKRILAAFASNEIEIPFPHRVMIGRPPGRGGATMSVSDGGEEPAANEAASEGEG